MEMIASFIKLWPPFRETINEAQCLEGLLLHQAIMDALDVDLASPLPPVYRLVGFSNKQELLVYRNNMRQLHQNAHNAVLPAPPPSRKRLTGPTAPKIKKRPQPTPDTAWHERFGPKAKATQQHKELARIFQKFCVEHYGFTYFLSSDGVVSWTGTNAEQVRCPAISSLACARDEERFTG